jgi:TolA-binding protein
MTRVDLHPEELLDRADSGALSREERVRVEAHLASCSACRFEHALVGDCKRGAATQPGDDVVVERIRASVTRALEERRRPVLGVARGRQRTRALLACAALVLLTTLGAATVILRERRLVAEERARALSAVETVRTVNHSATVVVPPEPPAKGDAPAEPASVNDPETRLAAPKASTAVVAAQRAKAPESTAAEVFARANQLRRAGDANEAVRAYRELQRSFPGSSEALVSRVALGRLLLDRLGNPAGALGQFDSYLASSRGGSLGEEALVGRALAVGRLGRSSEECRAWSTLLIVHPTSTYAARARARIEQLSSR